MGILFDKRLTEIRDLPYTLAFVIRKRLQVDNLNEFPEEKRPSEHLIWNGTADDINSWLKKAIENKTPLTFRISEDEIE
jgi:hypothetical protein